MIEIPRAAGESWAYSPWGVSLPGYPRLPPERPAG